jgi:hypothetical protein
MDDFDYSALSKDATKAQIAQALISALEYSQTDGIDDPANARFWNAEHTVYSATWSPGMVAELLKRAKGVDWNE